MAYVSKIYTVTCSVADVWYLLANKVSSLGDLKGWLLKPTEDTPNEFDFSFDTDQNEVMTNSGQGHEGLFGIKDVYVRSPISGGK